MSSAAAKRQRIPNVIKAPAHPKRSIENPGEDHPLGLWVDRELLRKHMTSRTPKLMISQENFFVVHNHYLELADVALKLMNEKEDRVSK